MQVVPARWILNSKMMMIFFVIFVALFFVALTVAIAGFAAVLRFVHRKIGVIPVWLLIAVVAASPLVAWNRYAHHHALSHVPVALNVSTIAFEATKSMGFGPGGAEEGLLLYELPEAAAHLIERDGVRYLDSLYRASENRDANADYSEWHATPAIGRGFPLASTLCGEDCPNIPAHLRDRVNAIVANPGSFFASRRDSKIIVVSPGERLVVIRYGK